MSSDISNWKFSDNKNLYIYGGIALACTMYRGLSWLLKRFKTYSVNPWLEEYCRDAKDKFLELNDKKRLSPNFMAFIYNLMNEIQDYLYKLENSSFEVERRSYFKDKSRYEELVFESFELVENYQVQAAEILFKKTGISFDLIKENLANVDQREFKTAMITEKKNYYESELPKISKSELKEAYITYAKTFSSHNRINQEQMIIMQRKPEYQEIGFKTIITNKYLLKDLIFTKYGIEAKYLNQLVEKNHLLSDTEVSYHYEDIRRSSSMEM